MSLLAIDFGSTHCKAGLFAENGAALRIASRSTPLRRAPAGWSYFDPDEILKTIAGVVQDAVAGQPGEVAAVGIASMAETGLLVDRLSGQAVSPLLPWFETASQPNADLIAKNSDPFTGYQKYGLKINFKSPLAKILWLRQSQGLALEKRVWLSAADFVAAWLTGAYQTDCSLAGRTYCFRVDRKEWDRDWLRDWDLPEDLFPAVAASGKIAGGVSNPACDIPRGTPVAVCGHDHVCAAAAMGAVRPGGVFDSMGTAEALIGALPERPLTREDYDNGLLYGCHVVDGMGYWMGGLSASGGSIEWFRQLMGPPPLSYEDLQNLMDTAGTAPTGILYFPYLLGSGSPHTDGSVRGAFIGLTAGQGAADLLKAMLEGTAYEMEIIRQAGERMTGQPIATLVAAGGGTRNRLWTQIKADVSGCSMMVSGEPEATLLGAALVVGIGTGIYADIDRALAAVSATRKMDTIVPNMERHAVYQDLFEKGYLAFQESLRNYQPHPRARAGDTD